MFILYVILQECSNSENSVKKVASNACVACLGMLQTPMCDKIIDKVSLSPCVLKTNMILTKHLSFYRWLACFPYFAHLHGPSIY